MLALLLILLITSTKALFHGLPIKTPTSNKPITIHPSGLPSLNDESLQLHLDSPTLSVVLFTSDWCGPCKNQKAVLEQLMGSFESTNFGSVDTDLHFEAVERFNIRSIPTTAFFRDGKMVAHVVGAMPKHVLVDEIIKHMS